MATLGATVCTKSGTIAITSAEQVRFYDSNYTLLRTSSCPNGRLRTASFLSTGNLGVVSQQQGTVLIISPSTGELIQTLLNPKFLVLLFASRSTMIIFMLEHLVIQ